MHRTLESGLFESGEAPSEDELAAARMKIEDSVTTVVPCTAEQLQTRLCSTGMLHGNTKEICTTRPHVTGKSILFVREEVSLLFIIW